ncbi:MAG: hypothetical protein R2838_00100 [Caldilineaceae bacterium]
MLDGPVDAAAALVQQRSQGNLMAVAVIDAAPGRSSGAGTRADSGR